MSGVGGGDNGEKKKSLTIVMTIVIYPIVVSKGELKAKMLAYFRKVEETGEELIVTDNRVPVLKVIPLKEKASHSREEIFPKSHKIQYRSAESLIESEADEWGENFGCNL